MAEQRAIQFDVLKGIAILLVVLGHIYRTSLHCRYSAVEDIIYIVHMPLFVLVSGYFTQRKPSWTKHGIYSYWKGKILRLLLPLLFIAELHSIISSGEVGLPLQSMVGAYWFTYALFLIFGVFYFVQAGLSLLFIPLKKKQYNQYIYDRLYTIGLLLSIIVIEALITYLYTLNSRLCNGLVLYKVAHLYKYLILGHLIGRYPTFNKMLQSEGAGAIGFMGFSVLYIIKSFGYTFPQQETLLALLGLAFIYSAVQQITATISPDVLERERERERKIIPMLSYLGQVSLPIYFIHYFFLPDLSLLSSYDNLLSHTPLNQFAFQSLLGLLTSCIVLIPTLLLVSITRTNKYLRFYLYGEPLPSKIK